MIYDDHYIHNLRLYSLINEKMITNNKSYLNKIKQIKVTIIC